MYGTIDFSRINTEPGTRTAFSPPAGWQGDYLEYMRERWRLDPGVRQHVAVVTRMLARGEKLVFVGRFARSARRIVARIAGKQHARPTPGDDHEI